ncbi:MAG: SEC59/DGK1/VTE5 family protein [Treponema sp.]|nr:SEC59/DGK1/VTE5 family protein [Spirochaetia bacterium]MDY2840451.1 SEC59/DGK1/VTE5 family protein [Treponema sp.]MDY5124370.1 SEC59/DGK1/VTE5 family protein [Treponema sp.]
MQNNILEGIVVNQRKNSILKELFRKTIHICSAFVPLLLHYFYWPVMILLVLAAAGYTLCEFLRLHNYSIPLISKITEIAARKRDENKFVLGPVTLVLGILLAAFLLPLEYATVGIFALSFGDGCASLVGKIIGKITIPGARGKTVAGSLACFFAVFLAAFCYSGNCLISLIIGVSAMVIEVLPLADADNLIIPISIGFIYKLLCGLNF